MGRITRDLFALPTLELAPRLLGLELVHETAAGTAAGRIVEVEAYLGPADRAAHTYGGRRTERVRAMWGPPGHAYVYFVYGMHWCFNVVACPEGVPQAILVRALAPTQGIPLMAQRRGVTPPPDGRAWPLGKLRQLTSGPARLCAALGITGEQYGWDLVTSSLYLRTVGGADGAGAGEADGAGAGRAPAAGAGADGPCGPAGGQVPPEQVVTGPRIGIDYAGPDREHPWRFWVRGDPFVSR